MTALLGGGGGGEINGMVGGGGGEMSLTGVVLTPGGVSVLTWIGCEVAS